MADDSSSAVASGVAIGTPPAQYYITNGVRRSVAAREVGLPDIAARIVEPGKPDVPARLPLDQLHSPKDSVPRDSRYLLVEWATRAGRIGVPIEVQPLGLPGQLLTVPLSQVQLV